MKTLVVAALLLSGCSWLGRLLYSPSCGENPCQHSCGCSCPAGEKCF